MTRARPYILHYAPDNASLVVRLALELGQIPYETALVDRSLNAQSSAAYRALNPQGTIPVVETPEGPMFETAAILLWLCHHHKGLAPECAQGRRLPWLFALSNTLHPALRQSFYPEKFIDAPHHDALRAGLRDEIARFLTLVEAEIARAEVFGTEKPNVLDFYLACMLRWAQLYPKTGPVAPDLSALPHLADLLTRLDAHPATLAAIQAEGLGPTPFSAPSHANPPEGSAT